MSDIRDAVEAAAKELEGDPEKETEAEAAPVEEVQTDDPPEEAPAPAEPEPVSPPEAWAENEAIWASMTPEVQAQIIERENALASQLQESQTAGNELDPEVAQVLGAIRADAERYNMSEAQALSRLFNAHQMLSSNPQWGLRHLAQQYNVNLASLVEPGAPEGDPETQADPMAAQIQQLTQGLQYLAQSVDQRFQQNATSHMEAQVDNWAKEKDANGNLLRPHFEEVGDEVAALIPVLKKANPNSDGFTLMQKAYDKAIAGRGGADFDARVAAEVEKRLAAQSAEATKAKEAAVSVKSSVSAKDAPVKEEDLEGFGRPVNSDDVRKAWNSLQAGSGRI